MPTAMTALELLEQLQEMTESELDNPVKVGDCCPAWLTSVRVTADHLYLAGDEE